MMDEIIQNLKELGSIPLVTIPVGAVAGAIVAFLLSVYSKRSQDNRITSQVLSYINIEIYDNFVNRIKSEYPYTDISVKGFDLTNAQAGNLRIKETQLKEINRIYIMFRDINKKIKNIRDLKLNSLSNTVSNRLPPTIFFEGIASADLKKIQNDCYLVTSNYIKKYCENKS